MEDRAAMVATAADRKGLGGIRQRDPRAAAEITQVDVRAVAGVVHGIG
jgi:hypothetical protein